MPANLPPDYFEAEKQYREAKTNKEKISCLEKMLTLMPKHKGTDKLRADIRRRISRLKDPAVKKKGATRHESVFHIDKEGAGMAVVIGAANTGKSSVVDIMTNASPEVADYPNTTWQPTPGMMPVDDIQIQLIDTPPLDREYIEPDLLDLIRRADLVLLVVNLHTDPVDELLKIVDLLDEYRIVPMRFKENYTDQHGIIFIPFLVLANKYDDHSTDENFEIFRELLEDDWPMIPVSTITGRNLEKMKRLVIERLDIIRVYSKAPGKEPDRTAPFTLKRGSTVEDFAGKVHQDFVQKLKTARLWGESVFDGQMVQRDHVLEDGDVVELRI